MFLLRREEQLILRLGRSDFETVQDKSTDLDAPDPEWKYLSGFAVWKGPVKSGVKGVFDGLLAPRRGPTMAITVPLLPNEPAQPTNQQQDLQILAIDDDNESNLPTPPQPAHQTAPQVPQQQLEHPLSAACQMYSGRVIRNTPCYEQSISQRNQGLVAWEILLDQDEQGDAPTVTSQYATQRALKDPIAFAASDNPDILY